MSLSHALSRADVNNIVKMLTWAACLLCTFFCNVPICSIIKRKNVQIKNDKVYSIQKMLDQNTAFYKCDKHGSEKKQLIESGSYSIYT